MSQRPEQGGVSALPLCGRQNLVALHSKKRATHWLVMLCWLPGVACAHGGPCSDDFWLATAASVASACLSLLAVLLGPILAVRLSPGRWGWRFVSGVMLALVGWAAAAVVAFVIFVMGQGCARAWTLAGICILPALVISGILLVLRVLRDRIARRGLPNP